VVTSSALESDRIEAIASGDNEFIQKPLALDKFSKAVESILHRWLPN
jgi:DNA-binding response OmpR family regulator